MPLKHGPGNSLPTPLTAFGRFFYWLHMAKRGRPQMHSDEDIAEVLRMMGDDAISVKAAAKKLGIDYSTVWKRIGESQELTDLYARSTEEYARTMVERLHSTARDEPDVQRARLMCDNIKWEAQRVCRKIYGDKTEITGKDGGALTIEIVNFVTGKE